MSFNYCPALATEAGIHCVPDIAVLIAIYIAQRNITHDFIFLFDQINAYEKGVHKWNILFNQIRCSYCPILAPAAQAFVMADVI